jgi:hypothetical protein
MNIFGHNISRDKSLASVVGSITAIDQVCCHDQISRSSFLSYFSMAFMGLCGEFVSLRHGMYR